AVVYAWVPSGSRMEPRPNTLDRCYQDNGSLVAPSDHVPCLSTAVAECTVPCTGDPQCPLTHCRYQDSCYVDSSPSTYIHSRDQRRDSNPPLLWLSPSAQAATSETRKN